MAQPVFDEHPLEQYLKQTGEGVERMPGTMLDLPSPYPEDDDDELDSQSSETDDKFFGLAQLLPPGMIRFVETLLSTASKHTLPSREFAERFKYVVISSSLLSPSLSTPATTTRRSWPPAPPTQTHTTTLAAKRLSASSNGSSSGAAGSGVTPTLVLAIFAVLALMGGEVVMALMFGTGAWFLKGTGWQDWIDGGGGTGGGGTPAGKTDVVEPTFTALNELINASNLWDSAVQEAIAILEKDERGPSSPSTSTSLRIALHTTLTTTETQSENVRQLLSALASHTELSQLSEMYAPPSPIRSTLTLDATTTSPSAPPSNLPSDHHQTITVRTEFSGPRPMTLPMTRKRTRTLSAPEGSKMSKGNRASWSAGASNFSYSALAEAGSPNKGMLRRRDKRRSDLSALLEVSGSNLSLLPPSRSTGTSGSSLGVGLAATGSTSAPASPLPLVEELEEGDGLTVPESKSLEGAGPSGSGSIALSPGPSPSMGRFLPVTPEEKQEETIVGEFGAAALEMRRKRRTGGFELMNRARDSRSSTASGFGSSLSTQGSPVNKRYSKAFYGGSSPRGPSSDPSSSSNRHSMLSFPPSRAQGRPVSMYAPSTTSASRFTTLHPSSRTSSPLSQSQPHNASTTATTSTASQPVSRHPLSISSLHQALQSALSSKRYAASHLLALRFEEEDDFEDVYWDDVRSVMGLLTSALSGAVMGLCQVLDEVEGERLRDETPSPALDIGQGSRVSFPLPSYHHNQNLDDSDFESAQFARFPSHSQISKTPVVRSSLSSSASVNRVISRKRTMEEMRDFAPVPSHLARFAEHVDAISGALHEAHMQLEMCVGALSDGEPEEPEPESQDEGQPAKQTHEALEAYERLRRELGLALRECERGRERLLEIIMPRRNSTHSHSKSASTSEDDVPALGPDAGSEDLDSDRPRSIGFPKLSGDGDAVLVEGHQPEFDHENRGLGLKLDDEELVLGLGEIPIEQVFEAESAVGRFTRERSKLSREERIKLAKAKRESGGLVLDSNPESAVDGDDDGIMGGRRERWGPGGEVVQELKDVIWKVGEKRRKMAEAATSSSHSRSQSSIPMPMQRDGHVRASPTGRERGASVDASKLFGSASPQIGNSASVPRRPLSVNVTDDLGRTLAFGLGDELNKRLSGLNLNGVSDVVLEDDTDSDDETAVVSSLPSLHGLSSSSIPIPEHEDSQASDQMLVLSEAS